MENPRTVSDTEIVQYAKRAYGAKMGDEVLTCLMEPPGGFQEHVRRSFTREILAKEKEAEA